MPSETYFLLFVMINTLVSIILDEATLAPQSEQSSSPAAIDQHYTNDKLLEKLFHG